MLLASNMVLGPRMYYHVASNMIMGPRIHNRVASNMAIDLGIYYHVGGQSYGRTLGWAGGLADLILPSLAPLLRIPDADRMPCILSKRFCQKLIKICVFLTSFLWLLHDLQCLY